MSSVLDIDKGFKAMLREFKKLKRGASTTVGIQDAEALTGRGPGQNNASLARVHEFGSNDGKIPQRSFIRSTVDREKRLIDRGLEKAVKSGVANGDVRRQLGRLGEKMRGEMIRTIDSSIGIAANAPSTIAQKGSSRPLVDTGIMKNSITSKVHGP